MAHPWHARDVRAARVHTFGQGLRIDDVPEPEPGPDEVLVHVSRAAVNPVDVWLTEGTVAGGSQPLPFVPGVEGVGTVDGRSVMVRGSGVGIVRDGVYRERAVVPTEAVFELPEGLDSERVAGSAVTGTTAWALVNEVAKVTAGDRVLVLGASGGVGTMAVQLAGAAGAVVWGQTSNPQKASFVEQLGPDRVIVASAHDLAEATAELEPTVALDPLGDGFTVACIQALQPGGRLALFGTSAGAATEMDLRTLYRKSIQLLTYSGTLELEEERNRRALNEVIRAVAGGELRVVVDDVLPLERAAEAHRRIKYRQSQGKLLLAP
jgi:NADPH2:quinone reductase